MGRSIRFKSYERRQGPVCIVSDFLFNDNFDEIPMVYALTKEDKKKAKYTITIGDTEVENNNVKIKNMENGTEEIVKVEEIMNYIK